MAAAIERALDGAIATTGTRTADLGGPLGTAAFGKAVASALSEDP
jgi:isocitrate/isopropylmalate dehydrogenase